MECRLALTPVAIMEGMAFAATAFGNKPTPPDYGKVLAFVLPVRFHPQHCNSCMRLLLPWQES